MKREGAGSSRWSRGAGLDRRSAGPVADIAQYVGRRDRCSLIEAAGMGEPVPVSGPASSEGNAAALEHLLLHVRPVRRCVPDPRRRPDMDGAAGAYPNIANGPPAYANANAVAKSFLAAAAERIV